MFGDGILTLIKGINIFKILKPYLEIISKFFNKRELTCRFPKKQIHTTMVWTSKYAHDSVECSMKGLI